MLLEQIESKVHDCYATSPKGFFFNLLFKRKIIISIFFYSSHFLFIVLCDLLILLMSSGEKCTSVENVFYSYFKNDVNYNIFQVMLYDYM